MTSKQHQDMIVVMVSCSFYDVVVIDDVYD